MCVMSLSFSSLSPQTNVYPKAQKRKMLAFDAFKRKAVVIIPPHHELRKRTSRRAEEMGSSVPPETINAMKGGRDGGVGGSCRWGVGF